MDFSLQLTIWWELDKYTQIFNDISAYLNVKFEDLTYGSSIDQLVIGFVLDPEITRQKSIKDQRKLVLMKLMSKSKMHSNIE